MDKATATILSQAPLISEDEFRSLVEQAPVWIWTIDSSVNITYVNKTVLAYVGMSRIKDVAGKLWEQVAHPDDIERVYAAVSNAITTGTPYSVEIRFKKASTGKYRWFLCKGVPRKSLDGIPAGFIGTAVDIHQQKMTESQLADSEQRFSKVFNQTSVGISKTDLQGNYVMVNKRYCEMIGWSQKQLLGMSTKDTTHPGDYANSMEARRQAAKGLKRFVVEKRYVRQDGTIIWAHSNAVVLTDVNGDPEYILAVVQDITERKIAQKKLLESEKRLKAIFRQTTAGILQTDLETNLTYVNPGFCQIVGRTPQELYKLTISDITHPDDIADNLRQLKKIIKDGKEFVIRKRYVRPDGSFVWVRNNISVIKDDDGKPQSILAVSVNIHEQEESAQALQASEEKFRLATAAGKVGTWEWNILTDRTTWSDELHHIYGIEPGDFTGGLESDLSLIHPDDKDMVAEVYNKSVHRGNDFEIEFRIFRSDGKIRWISERGLVDRNEDGDPVRISGTRIDITERKMTQEALRQSESRLRFMAESMPQKVFAAKPTGERDYFNPQWTEFSGLSIDEIKNWGWTQLVHPDDLKENMRRWKHSIKTGKPFESEHRLRRRDGTYRWHISRANAMRDESGAIVRWFGSNTDIDDIKKTTRRKNELETATVALKKQQTELLMLNQAKDEFISLASHQLRTPASGVKQLLGMLLEGYVDPLTPDQEKLIARANETNEREILVINDLLRVAQVDAGKVELHYKQVELVSLIQNVIEDQSGMFLGRRQTVRFRHRQDKVSAMLDGDKVRMVLENLIDNASKYTYPGKNIEVNIASTPREITIAIKDEGVGIRKKDITKLFHKFSRLENSLSILVGGTGLGLYWANKIVELHGGHIEVDSKLKKGTTFIITLPVSPSGLKNIAKPKRK